MGAKAVESETRELLLTAAMEFVEARGYNAFSYRDLSESIGIRTASIHYHFPTKADLGVAMVVRHRQDNAEFFQRVDGGGGTAFERLKRYCEAFRKSYGKGARICFAGMMATDSESLTPEVLAEVRGCYSDHEEWLTRTLKDGHRKGEVQFHESAAIVARAIFDALEGAMFATRAFRTPQRLVTTINWCLRQIEPRS
ncbi:TetR/AcrR family transcriptional regulator [soil metagenome]